MKIAIGCDHAGFPLKQTVADKAKALGHEVIDCGVFTCDRADYPDYAQKVAEAVSARQADRGILLCGSGVGVCIAANKVRGARACVCHDSYSARQGVEHDNMNILCLGARIIGPNLAEELTEQFLGAAFSGESRHQLRLNKVQALENKYFKQAETGLKEEDEQV